jgi:hypothetical protein
MISRSMCRFANVQMCRCRCRIAIAINLMFVFIACSPTPSETPLKSVNEDSMARVEYDSLRHIRFLDSMSAVKIRDSIQLANTPPASVEPIRKHIEPVPEIVYPCQIENPDTSIYGVVFDDSYSSIQALGKEWNLIEDNVDMPHQSYSNAHGSQFLTCFFHYGGGRYGYSEFQVSTSCKEPKVKTFSDEEFVSGNGIRLGMSIDSVVSIIGKCYSTDSINGHIVIKYIADDYKGSELLQHFNYPKYYAEYEFSNNKLIRFRFGFEYP